MYFKYWYHLVFEFRQFLVFKLPYLLNQGRFCYFDPQSWAFFPPFGAFIHTLMLNKGIQTTIDGLKYIIKCLYQLVFRFDQFLDFRCTYLLNYWQFCDFDPPHGPFFSLLPHFFHTLRLNKGIFTTIECLKYIIKCLQQLVFRFSQVLDFKLTYLLNYWRFCDFDPLMGLFSAFCHIFLHTLRLNK